LRQLDKAYQLFAWDEQVNVGRMLQPWNLMGYPFYSGVGRYTHEVNVKKVPQKVWLSFQQPDPVIYLEPVADVLGVWVNSQWAGARIWAPWQVEITELLTPGINTITIDVTNSLENAISFSPKPSGILWVPTLRFIP